MMSKPLQALLLSSFFFLIITTSRVVAKALPSGNYSRYCSLCAVKGTVLRCRCNAYSSQPVLSSGVAQATELYGYLSGQGATTGYAFSAQLNLVKKGERCVMVSAIPSGGLSCTRWVKDPSAKATASNAVNPIQSVKVTGGMANTHSAAVQNCPFVCMNMDKQWTGDYATDYCGCR